MWTVIAVFVTACLTFLATYSLEWLRNRREGKLATSIACAELLEARRAVWLAQKYNKWPVGWHNMNWSESWAKYRPILAERLVDEDFRTLHRAYLEMRFLQSGLAAGSRELEDDDKTFLERTRKAVETANALPLCAALSVPCDDELFKDAVHPEESTVRNNLEEHGQG
jgi:hypothetical protein